jgi:hypothetical protein
MFTALHAIHLLVILLSYRLLSGLTQTMRRLSISVLIALIRLDKNRMIMNFKTKYRIIRIPMRKFFSWLFQRELKEVLRETVEEIRSEVKESVTKEAEERIASCKNSLYSSLDEIKKGIEKYHTQGLNQ